ncbi:LacI family transcriptional regulator [Opitutaceae bacterium TAV5]|nr:LacI family transcriptional regulator [Opitutaceae bacterium TAV5]
MSSVEKTRKKLEGNNKASEEEGAWETPKRWTQRELARRLGVSQATVSRVLAKGGRHSEETRRQIMEKAGEMGYRPDPALLSLSAYRWKRRSATQESLAWFGGLPPAASGYEQLLFQAARARAEVMGYGMEYFWEYEPGYSPKRYAQIFSARGIAGVAFGPRPRPHARIELEIGRFAAVTLGRSVDWPPVDRVSVDHFQTMELCYSAVRERGFVRIGFSMTENYSERTAGLWMGAFLAQQVRHYGTGAARGVVKIPPLLDDEAHSGGRFETWFRKWRPDAIITMGEDFGCLASLRRMGVRFPEDVGVALLVVPCYVPKDFPNPGGFSGILEPVAGLAAFAVDILVGRIRNNERGIPKDRRVHLLPGAWHEGTTLR